MFSLEILPVVGLPQSKGWSQVITNVHDELIATFAISGPNANDHGRDVAEIWRRSAPKSAANLHQLLLDVIRRVHQANCEIYFAVGLFLDSDESEIPTVFATYNGSILMRKNNKIGQLLHSQGELKVVEGTAQNEMIVVLATQATHSFAGEISQKLHQGFEIGTIVTSLIPGIHGLPDSSLHACSFLICQIPEKPLNHEEPVKSAKPSMLSPLATATVDQSKVDQPKMSENNSTGGPQMELSPAVMSAVQSATLEEHHAAPAYLTHRTGLKKYLFKFSQLIASRAALIQQLIKQAPQSANIWLPRLGMVSLILILVWTGWNWRQREIAQDLAGLEEKIKPLVERAAQAEQTTNASPTRSRQEIAAVVQELDAIAKTYS